MRNRIVALVSLMAMVGLLIAAGRPGVVRTKDGGVYDGEVEEKQDVVAVTVRGIQTSIARENIASITYGDLETRWNAAYAKLDEKDVKGRIELGRRAFDERRYDLAEKALKDALAIDPNNAEAAELLRLTLVQKRMEKNTGTGTGSTGTGTSPDGVRNAQSQQYTALSPEQIQVIKRAELSEADTKVNIGFKNNVLKRYHDADPNTGMNYTQFQRQPNTLKALMVIRNGGKDLAKDIEINNDPATMLAFRRDVMPIVLSGCATSSCHGGNNESTKEFGLITPAPSNADVYTNYYVIQKYKKNVSEGVVEGMLNPTNALMIDRLSPEQSLLLQYGLPVQNADRKHPTVRGYNGVFTRGRDDPKYKAIENWISSLGKVDPRYDIDFTFERRGNAAEPTPAPATAPAKP